MTETSPDALRSALRAIVDPAAPAAGRDIVVTGRVDSLDVRDGHVHLALRAERAEAAEMEQVRAEAEVLLARQPGVARASAVLTGHRPEPPSTPPATPGAKPKLLADTRFVVLVASGKGGVGKSTVAVNLAVALAQDGHRVGLLDADVHGPSVPRMLGIGGKPGVVQGRMVPMQAHGIRALSLGMLVDADSAMIWRGPMVMGALEQLMGQAAWGPLDVMVVDMPPGTGDAQLTMAQRVNVAGAVVVSTPQDIALIDARRGVRMFNKTGVRVLGVVENMSVFCCPSCGHRSELFGHGGARREAAALGVPFLGDVPFLLDIRSAGDDGAPVAAGSRDSPAAAAFHAIARGVWDSLAA